MARILRRRVVKPTRVAGKSRVSPQEINQWLQLGLSTAKIAEALIPDTEGEYDKDRAAAEHYARSQKGPAQREYERQLREGAQPPESPLTPQLAQPASTQQLPPRTQEAAPSDQGASIKDQIFQGQYVRDEEVFPPVESRTPEERIDAKARRLFALSMRPNRGFEERRVEEIDFAPGEVEGYAGPGAETFTELEVAQSIQDRVEERAAEVLSRADEALPGGEAAWEYGKAVMGFDKAEAIARKELGVIDRMEADWGAGWTDESSQPQPPAQPPAQDFATYGPVSLRRRTWDEAQAEARAQVEEEDRQLELEQAEYDASPKWSDGPPETGMVPSPPTPETKQLVISTLQGLYAAMRQAKTFEEGAALLGQLHDLVKPEGWTFEVLGYGMGKKRDQAYKTALKYLKRSSPENEKGYAKILAKQRADSRKRQDQIDKEGRGEARQAKKEGRAETRKIATEARKLASDIAKEGRLWKKFTKEQKVRLEDNKTLTRLRARLRPGRQGRRSVKESLMLSGVLDATKKVTRAVMNEAKWGVEVDDNTAALAKLGADALTDDRDVLKAAVKLAKTEKKKAIAERKAAERRGVELLGRTPAAPRAPTPPKPPTSGGPVRKPATEFF